MVTDDTISGNKELVGTLRLNCMIPVPTQELSYYNISLEKDLKYKDVVKKEYEYIKTNSSFIIKNSNLLYKQKTKEKIMFKDGSKKPNYLNSVINFSYAEEKCLEYCKLYNLIESSKIENKPPINDKPIPDNRYFMKVKVSDLEKIGGLKFEKRINRKNPENAIIAIDKSDIDIFKNALEPCGNNHQLIK